MAVQNGAQMIFSGSLRRCTSQPRTRLAQRNGSQVHENWKKSIVLCVISFPAVLDWARVSHQLFGGWSGLAGFVPALSRWYWETCAGRGSHCPLGPSSTM